MLFSPDRSRQLCLSLALTSLVGCGVATTATVANPKLQTFPNATGTHGVFDTAGTFETTGPFFQEFGVNGRTCQSCHEQNQGMSSIPTTSQALFASTSGTDALFASIDGANCPSVPTGDALGHSLALTRALIRIPVNFNANPEFKIKAAYDPYGCAITQVAGVTVVSAYRRSLPAANLPDMSLLMWDTRETIDPLNSESNYVVNLDAGLNKQAVDAVRIHTQATEVLDQTDAVSMVAFEKAIYTAQETDTEAGSLSADGAKGGSENLAGQYYYPGINDTYGNDPTGAKFNPDVFTLFTAWENSSNAKRASIAAGEKIFNEFPLTITGVHGFNDNPTLGSPATVTATCTSCHNAPNFGSRSLALPVDTGTSHLAAYETDAQLIASLQQLSQPDLPIYEITGCKDSSGSPITYRTTDPGKGLISGKCADVSTFKMPTLRGLASRAPYFHNGSAASLDQVIGFYNVRYKMNLTDQQKTDLKNFLNAL